MEVEFHAAKSGHSNFSESTEEKKPLTEDEKKEQLARLEEKLRQKVSGSHLISHHYGQTLCIILF